MIPALLLFVGFCSLAVLDQLDITTEGTLWFIFWVYSSLAIVILLVILAVVILAATSWGKVDNIHLRTEILIESFILLACFVLEAVAYIVTASRDLLGEGDADLLSQITYFLCLSISAVASFVVIAVSTQYVAFVANRKEKNRFLKLAVYDDGMVSKKDVDFAMLISTRHGLDGFRKFLSKGANEQKLHNLIVESYAPSIYRPGTQVYSTVCHGNDAVQAAGDPVIGEDSTVAGSKVEQFAARVPRQHTSIIHRHSQCRRSSTQIRIPALALKIHR